MGTEIFWHGHSNVQINAAGRNVIIDPFFTGNPVCVTDWRTAPRPDLVLVTHDHGDHVGDAVDICRTTDALCGAVYDTVFSLAARGLPESRIGLAGNIGGTIELLDMRVTITPAVHTSETGAPVGYVIRMPNGFTVYHAGDTALFGDMALISQFHQIDLALLPIGDVFTMNPEQAVHACTLLRPRAVMPMHWGTFPPLEQSPADFAERMRATHPDIRCITVQPGQSFTI